MNKNTNIEIEGELINWMIDFHKRMTELQLKFSDKNNQDIRGLKYEYSKLKLELREKKNELNRINDKSMIIDIEKFNRCKSNIFEAAAYGFTEHSNSTNLLKLETSLNEARYKISKFMVEFLNKNKINKEK